MAAAAISEGDHCDQDMPVTACKVIRFENRGVIESAVGQTLNDGMTDGIGKGTRIKIFPRSSMMDSRHRFCPHSRLSSTLAFLFNYRRIVSRSWILPRCMREATQKSATCGIACALDIACFPYKRKPEAMVRCSQTSNLLASAGMDRLVRRGIAKEERRQRTAIRDHPT